MALVEVERHGLQVPKDVGAQVQQESLTKPTGEQIGDERNNCLRQRQHQIQHRNAEEQLEVPRHQHIIDHNLEQPDVDDLDRRQDHGKNQCQRKPTPARSDVGPEATKQHTQRHNRCVCDNAGYALGLRAHRREETLKTSLNELTPPDGSTLERRGGPSAIRPPPRRYQVKPLLLVAAAAAAAAAVVAAVAAVPAVAAAAVAAAAVAAAAVAAAALGYGEGSEHHK